MSRFRLTSSAARDLAEIVAYVVERDPAAALRIHARLREAMRKLASNPGMGHRRRDLTTDTSVRVWPVYSWLVVSEHEARPIRVVRILRGERDLGELLGDEPGERRS